MLKFTLIAAAMVVGQVQANGSLKDSDITANAPPSSIYEVRDYADRRVVTIELDGSVSIGDGLTVDEAAEKTYELASFRDECAKDYTYTYEFDFTDKNHLGIGNWTVALRPSGDVVYVGLHPTPLADEFFHKLAKLAGRGACHS